MLKANVSLFALASACAILTACGGGGATIGSGGGAPVNAGPSTPGPTPLPGSVATPMPVGAVSPSPAPSATPSGGAAAAAAVTIPTFKMPLTHNGLWLTDADGRVVIFHGLNVAYKSDPYTPQAQGFTQADAAMLAREGFSSVRLWIWWSAFEPTPGVWDDTSLAATKQFIGWLQQYGITVRLNFAQVIWGQQFGGIGFPDWAADDDGLPSLNLGGDIEDGTVEPSIQASFDNLYNNVQYPDSIGLTDHFNRAWVHVATYFKNVPGVIAYDIFNEPEAGTQTNTCNNPAGCPVFDTQTLAPFFKKVVAAIRSVDPVKTIEYEPYVLDASGLFATYVNAGTDPNLELTFHLYPQTDVGLPQTAVVAYKLFETDATNNDDAIENTEFGATDDLTQIQGVIDAADTEMMGWLYWAFYSTEPTGNPATPTTETINPQEGIIVDPQQPPTEANLKTAKLQVLDRPYPFLVAGTPQSWNFDVTTNVFTLTYATKPVSGGAAIAQPTIVVVPQRLYPSGYTASATGAAITSLPNVNALTVVASTGATTVTVTVSPAAATSSHARKAASPAIPRLRR